MITTHMQNRRVLVAASAVAVIISIAIATVASAGPIRSAATTFDSIDVDGLATIGGNLRVGGRVYRGAAGPRSDGKPFIVNDHAQVEGDLSIKGKLKSTGATLVLKDNAKITGNLALLGNLSDPEGTLTLADNTRVNGNLTVTGAVNTGGYTDLAGTLTSLGDLALANADATLGLLDFIDCIDAVTVTQYVDIDDWVFCMGNSLLTATPPELEAAATTDREAAHTRVLERREQNLVTQPTDR